MWPSNNSNYSWGPWTSQNNGSFCGTDQVDWASLAKQWMRHRDSLGTPDLSQQVDASQNLMWFSPLPSQPQTVFQDVDNFNMIENQRTGNVPNENLVNRNMPAWAVPPPPPPLPPDMDKTSSLDNQASIEPGSKQNFPAIWNHPNPTIFPNKMVDQIRTDFTYSTWMTSSSDNQLLDAAKRKQLPAWIREGLEKMEREKCKQMEKEQERLVSEMQGVNRNEFYKQSEESDKESEGDDEHEKETSPDHKSAEFLSEEEKIANLMMKVRQMLTEILLEVTNDEISSIANSVYHKAKSHQNRAPQTFALSSALASISALGADLGSDDEEDESDGSFSSGEDQEVTLLKIKKKRDAFEAKMALWNDDEELYKEENKILSNHHSQVNHGISTNELNDFKGEKIESICELNVSVVRHVDCGKNSFELKQSEVTSSDSRSSISSVSSRESSCEKRKLSDKKLKDREKIIKITKEKLDKEKGHEKVNNRELKHGKHDSVSEYSRKISESYDKSDKTYSKHSASTSNRSRKGNHRSDKKTEKRAREHAEEKRTKRRRSASNSSERPKSSRKDHKSERYTRRRESKSRSR